MPDKPKHSGLPPPPDSLFARLGEQFRLAWRLFQDNRVPIRVKLIPILGFAYVVSPFGLIPELIPVIGQIDAIAVTLLIVAWFNYAAPRVLVNEHLLYLRGRAKPVRRPMRNDGGIIIENRIHFTDETVSTANSSENASDDMDDDRVDTGNTVEAVDMIDKADEHDDNGDSGDLDVVDDRLEPEQDAKLFTKQVKR